jgi:hypothetical protein
LDEKESGRDKIGDDTEEAAAVSEGESRELLVSYHIADVC